MRRDRYRIAVILIIAGLSVVAAVRHFKKYESAINMKNIPEYALSALPADYRAIAPHGPVYVALRSNGLLVANAWADGDTWPNGITVALKTAEALLSRSQILSVDAVELCLTYDYRTISPVVNSDIPANVHRGILGIELSDENTTIRVCPTQMLTTNRSFERVIQRLEENHQDPESAFHPRFTSGRIFKAEQVLVTLRPEPSAMRMFRGNQLVAMNDVTRENVGNLISRMKDWVLNHVHDDGRVTYKYWPSNGKESSSNNMIRQFMATLCLVRLGQLYESRKITEIARRNLTYNLRTYYRSKGDLGLIEYDGKIKLGSTALAALSIVEASFHHEFSSERAALAELVYFLWQEDGSFKTFFKPLERNDNQNFYPGEALLYLATVYALNPEPLLLKRIQQSADYYRQWHHENWNPAFIPWHTQAYFIMWQATSMPIWKDLIFEMNDSLLSYQEWESAPYPDMAGRFYDPKRPDLGPPHASSTGVYLEGLVDAYKLAKQVNDRDRTSSYRQAILRGIRSLMQLEFADSLDMYYVSKKSLVQGGLRTTVYDNTIRVDNVQHGLMALMKATQAPDLIPDSIK